MPTAKRSARPRQAEQSAQTRAAKTFSCICGRNTGLAVSTGRGATAAADWAANKNMALPDYRGRVIAGFDDMGSTAAGRLNTSHGMSGSGIGGAGGAPTRTLLTANLPPYTPAGSIAITAINHATRFYSNAGSNDVNTLAHGNSGGTLTSPDGVAFVSGTATFTGTAAPGQVSTPVVTVPPTMFATIFVKM